MHRFTTLASLKEKHIEYLIDAWVEKKQERGTIENKLTYLSALATWLGIKQEGLCMMPPGSSLSANAVHEIGAVKRYLAKVSLTEGLNERKLCVQI